MVCPNCKETLYGMKEMATHTVACYRNSTKCRACGDIILKDKKQEHIRKFRDFKRLI
jgi:predicted transcriptional regulator